MTDIARLGLEIDSRPVAQASTALDKFQASANAAASGADKLQAATKTTGAQLATVSKAATVANEAMTSVAKSTGLTRAEMINLSRQIQDVGVSLASGQSPFMVLAQQGTQIADIFGSSKNASVGGALRQIGSSIAGVLTPMRLLVGGVAGLGIGFAVAANSIVKSELALDDLARSTDQTLGKLRGLQQATSFKGIGDESFSKGITEFADKVYEAKNNFGSLNSLMIANGKSAKDFSGYLGSVADLVARATSDMQKQRILREAGLPSDMAWVRFMEQGSKGIEAAVAGTVKFNESAEQNLIRKAREFDEAWNTATTKMVNYFKSAVVDITNALTSVKVPDWLGKIGTGALGAASSIPGVGALASAARLAGSAMGSSSGENFADRFGSFQKAANDNALAAGYNRKAAELRGESAPKTTQELMVANQQAQQRIALLGNLASVEDQVKAKELELAAAGLQGVGVSKQQRDAILNVVRAQAEMSRASEMASLGIFRVNEANKALRDTLKANVDRGLLDPNNAQEMTSALNALTKQMEDMSDAAKVAGSPLPQFQSALNEVGNARKQLDSALVEGMNINRGFFVEFGQQIRNGVSAWEAFKTSGLNALGKIADKLMSMAADKLFSSAFGGGSGGGGLLSLLGLGGGGGDLGNFTSIAAPGGGMMPFAAAGGGTFGAGAWGVVGEKGPELIKVNRGSVTVIPNHISRPYLPGFADGGTLDAGGGVRRIGFGQDNSPQVTIVQHNDFRNSDPGSEARLRQYVDQSRKMAVQESVQAVRTVQSQNPAYLRGGR
ncbi:phage tail length tape measure family protein [Bradyrhizobium sp. HKCCYLS2038]|uniref:phage tail length tape measure family protein n=1 Tax=Bradyrhizobium sp. HKCCYLS2038 TaxID=3420764 RepID=UPI003EC0C63E